LNQTLITRILRILNRGGDDLQLILSEVLGSIRESTGFDARAGASKLSIVEDGKEVVWIKGAG
jgi:hypothetical protein